jgi:hypothetical protein
MTSEIKRTEVAFEVRTHSDGRPYIALVLSRKGKPLPTNGREFSLELTEAMPPDVADTVASVLSQTIGYIAMTAAEPDERQT